MPPRKPTAASAKEPPDATPYNAGLKLAALRAAPGVTAASTTPAVAIATAAPRASVRCSPRITTPNIATWTASVLLNAVATENERACIAASSSAVPAICATAPPAV